MIFDSPDAVVPRQGYLPGWPGWLMWGWSWGGFFPFSEQSVYCVWTGQINVPTLSSQELGIWECIRVPLGPVPSETLVTFPRWEHITCVVTLASWGSQSDLCDCRGREGAWEAVWGSPGHCHSPSSCLEPIYLASIHCNKSGHCWHDSGEHSPHRHHSWVLARSYIHCWAPTNHSLGVCWMNYRSFIDEILCQHSKALLKRAASACSEFTNLK